MNEAIKWIEAIFAAIPLPFLEVWGRLGFLFGLMLMVASFGGFTFRLGGGWGVGWQRQTWNNRALISLVVTFVMIFATGYLGSFIVLVPGAQTFESLKDVSVFLCILLFGYPALIIVPIAYGLSDLIEGVPPSFLWDWIFGYFINPACFWVGYQLMGKNPDFRKLRTWGLYFGFVLIFMAIEPVLWGYVCAGKFTPEISYRNITPALTFTTLVTWLIAPFFMLGALPLARKYGLFWAEIPNHVKERRLGFTDWIWVSGKDIKQNDVPIAARGIPIQIVFVSFFVVLVLAMVGTTAYFVLRSAEDDANKLVGLLHQEVTANINAQLDEYLAQSQGVPRVQREVAINGLLQNLAVAKHGRAFIIDSSGRLIASSLRDAHAAGVGQDRVIQQAIQTLHQTLGKPKDSDSEYSFRFDVVTAKPLSRETWLGQTTRYTDREGDHADWVLMTALPEAYYLGGIRTGNSKSAMVSAIALLLSLTAAALLAAKITSPIRRLATATQALAKGDLSQRVKGSSLKELDTLSQSFNQMASQLTQYTERLQLATRAANMGIWDWDVSTNELVWDEAMYRLYGVRKEDFGGAYEAWANTLAPEDRARAAEDVQAALRGEREFLSEFGVIFPDGSRRTLGGMGRVVRNEAGHPVRMVGVNYDITERKLAEQELILHRDHLEKLVAERTLALSLAMAQAETANQAKSVFLANMSHELRTPLNAILGFTQILNRDNQLGEESRRNVATINRAGQHLLALINDVLDIARVESGRSAVENKPFDLNDVLTSIEEMIRGLAQNKGLVFQIEHESDLPVVVEGDGQHLKQILINLLGNAVKYTDRGSVQLRVSHQRDAIDFEVSDTGPGIPLAEQEQVFQPFYQTAAGVAKGEGTGLGLAISREYARMMGGTLVLKSQPGHGCVFTLSLPLPEAQLPFFKTRSGRVMGLEEGQEGWRILVVDDKPDNRELVKQLLEKTGFEVRTASDGQQAVTIYQSWQPSLIWMDMRMPVMDGYTATQQIRALPGGERVKIVALTASAFEEDRQRVLDAGCDDMVRKPLDEDQLFELMGELLDIRYRYAKVELISEASSALDLSSLPPNLLKELKEAADDLDLKKTEHIVMQLQVVNPGLAVALNALVQGFRFEQIAALCSKAGNKADRG